MVAMCVDVMVFLGLGAVFLCVLCCRLSGVECGRSGSRLGAMGILASTLSTDIELLFLRVDRASSKPAPWVESVRVTVDFPVLARLVLVGMGGVVLGVVVEDVEVVEGGLW